MNYILTIETGTSTAERRFEDKQDMRTFARLFKAIYPGAVITEGERAPKWHSPQERKAWREAQAKQG